MLIIITITNFVGGFIYYLVNEFGLWIINQKNLNIMRIMFSFFPASFVYLLQKGNRNAEAFVFLNHYLDVTDAIADGQNEMVDDTDLEGTDFPTNVPLPSTMYVDDEQHEQVKEWILTNAMDRETNQVKQKL